MLYLLMLFLILRLSNLSFIKMVGTWYVVAVKNSETNRIDIRQEGSTYVVDAFVKETG